MALTKKTRQARLVAGSVARARSKKSFERAQKNGGSSAIESISARELAMRIEGYLKSTGDKPSKFLEKIQERSKKNGTDKMSLREINAVIKEARKERQKKQK
jgi:hypothetical protein